MLTLIAEEVGTNEENKSRDLIIRGRIEEKWKEK